MEIKNIKIGDTTYSIVDEALTTRVETLQTTLTSLQERIATLESSATTTSTES